MEAGLPSRMARLSQGESASRSSSQILDGRARLDKRPERIRGISRKKEKTKRKEVAEKQKPTDGANAENTSRTSKGRRKRGRTTITTTTTATTATATTTTTTAPTMMAVVELLLVLCVGAGVVVAPEVLVAVVVE